MEGEEDDFGEIYTDNLPRISSIQKPISSTSPNPSNFTSQSGVLSDHSTVSCQRPNLNTGNREESVLRVHEKGKAPDIHLKNDGGIKQEQKDEVSLGGSLNGHGLKKDSNLVRVFENDEGLSLTKPTSVAKNGDFLVSNLKENNGRCSFANPIHEWGSGALAKHFVFDEFGSNEEEMKSWISTLRKDDMDLNVNMVKDTMLPLVPGTKTESDYRTHKERDEEDNVSEKSLNIILSEGETFGEVGSSEKRMVTNMKLEVKDESVNVLNKDLDGLLELGSVEMKERNQNSKPNEDPIGAGTDILLNQDHTSQSQLKCVRPDALPFKASNTSTWKKPEFLLPPDKTLFEIDINSFKEKPWREPGVDVSDYFNYGFDENTWKNYCKEMKQLRGAKIQVHISNGDRISFNDYCKTSRDSKDIIELVNLQHNRSTQSKNIQKNASGSRMLLYPPDQSCQVLRCSYVGQPPTARNKEKRLSRDELHRHPAYYEDRRMPTHDEWKPVWTMNHSIVEPHLGERLEGYGWRHHPRREYSLTEPSWKRGFDDFSVERRKWCSRDIGECRWQMKERATCQRLQNPYEVKNFETVRKERAAADKRNNNRHNRNTRKRNSRKGFGVPFQGQRVNQQSTSKRAKSLGPSKRRQLERDSAREKFVKKEGSEKLKKRSERFKPPKNWRANKNLEREPQKLVQYAAAAADSELRQRPDRKRKWASS